MRLIEDYIHAFRGPSGVRSACRVRLYLPDEAKPGDAPGDAPLVIVSELADNPGNSVTNAIEQIAAEVIDAHALTRVPVFVEHYPLESTGGCEETFDLVVFAYHEVGEVMRGGLWRREVGPPTWKPLGRRAIEVLVGFSV
jgi:hypothetical protein